MWSFKITPRFGDVDGLRHINNTVIPQWFESARGKMFRVFIPDLDFDKWNLIMARMEIDFLAQIFWQTDVEIISYVDRIGNSSFSLHQEVWQNGEKKAQGKFVAVYYDFTKNKSVPIPEAIRAKLNEHFVPAK
jgi:acyl-CoA thioester hydrolase